MTEGFKTEGFKNTEFISTEFRPADSSISQDSPNRSIIPPGINLQSVTSQGDTSQGDTSQGDTSQGDTFQGDFPKGMPDLDEQVTVRLLTLEEVAAVFRLDRDTVSKLVTHGLLPAIDLGETGGYRILFDDLKRFIEQRKEHAEQAAVLNQQKAEHEQKGLNGLCNWLKVEKRELANLYRELSTAMDKTARYLYEELNSAYRAGDHSKSRGIQEALAIIQQRWEKPRNSYSKWVFQSQERWDQALGTTIKELDGDIPTLISPWQADLLGNYLREDRPDNLALPLKHRHMEAERKLYREMSQWFQQEIRFLHDCYRELDHTVERTVKTLKSKTKKASKDLDFGRSQVLSLAMTNLYQEWERARSLYNHWLEGQEERWQHFKKDLAGY